MSVGVGVVVAAPAAFLPPPNPTHTPSPSVCVGVLGAVGTVSNWYMSLASSDAGASNSPSPHI